MRTAGRPGCLEAGWVRFLGGLPFPITEHWLPITREESSMCTEKKTCACRHAAATATPKPLAETDEFKCPMSRGEKPPELGPNTKCDKLQNDPE